MKKIAIIVCFLMSFSVMSQTDFRKGYIINSQGEKINGFINYKESSSIYEYCEFKTTLDGQIKEYYPNSIRGYGFENDKFFASKNISIEANQTENKFLEVIIFGIATLYKATGTYYLEKEGLLKELNNDVIEYTQNNNVFRRPSKKYIGILKVFLNDCPKVKSKIDATGYGEKSLEAIVRKYNECKGQKSVVYKEDKPWFKANFGASIGISSSSLNYDHKSTEVLYFTEKSNSSFSYLFGGFAELNSPRISEKISFYTGIFFSTNDFNTNMLSSNSSFNYISEVRTTLKQLKIPIGVRYTFPERNFTPYVTFGVSSYTNISSSTNWIRESEINNVVSISNKKYETGSLAVGYFASIGFKKKVSEKLQAFIDVVYENSTMSNSRKVLDPYVGASTGISDYQNSMSSLQVLIGIRF